MSNSDQKKGESLWLPGFENGLPPQEADPIYCPVIQEWVNACNKIEFINISAEVIKKIRRELGASCLISWNPAQQRLNFSSEQNQDSEDSDPWEDIGRHGTIREFDPLPPNYIYLTNQKQNGPCLVFTNKKPDQGIAIFYCDKIELDQTETLTGICSGTQIINTNDPEKFVNFFNKQLKILLANDNSK